MLLQVDKSQVLAVLVRMHAHCLCQHVRPTWLCAGSFTVGHWLLTALAHWQNSFTPFKIEP